MSAQILDGKALAAKMKENIRLEAAALRRQPGLAVILVIYIRHVIKVNRERRRSRL